MLNLSEGKKIVKLARKAIEHYLETGEKLSPPADVRKVMREERGVFVTLKKNSQLRGCIGMPLPTKPLVEAVIDSAIDASTRDPRFPSVRKNELKDISIEVSVLTVPETIDVDDSSEYLDKIEIGKDGLIVSCMGSRGLLLPQVPMEQDWDEEELLSQTCVKAGLSPDSWLREDVEVECFSAQIFKEKNPEGEVVEEKLSGQEGKTY